MELKFDNGVCDETKQFMSSVFEKLNNMGVLEECDMGAIRMLTVSYDMYVKASTNLLLNGPILYDKRDKPFINPAATLTKNYYAQVISFMKEFGLTIKSRENIKTLTPEVDEDNAIMGFIRNNKS
ncbi:MAG: phage terminase small subunit P27 family [Bacteroidaceae bacterium]